MNTVHKPTSFAEIIESHLTHYTAQCWAWNAFPSFGSLVVVQDGTMTVFGIVTAAQTGSIDPTRTPFAYQKTEAELLSEQPHIFEFLKTTFTVQICGYTDGYGITYGIPATPCKIHTFISAATAPQLTMFFSSAEFIELLYGFSQQIPNLDELLLAIIRYLKTHQLVTQALLEDLSHRIALLSGNDYRRIKVLLSRLETAVK